MKERKWWLLGGSTKRLAGQNAFFYSCVSLLLDPSRFLYVYYFTLISYKFYSHNRINENGICLLFEGQLCPCRDGVIEGVMAPVSVREKKVAGKTELSHVCLYLP